LGPFAGNFTVFAYHYFRTEELESAFRPEQLVFPAVWLVWTGLCMMYQAYLYPSLAWWIVLRWREAVSLEDNPNGIEENNEHTMDPIIENLPEPEE
jgi:hypothetical protein